MRKEEREVVLFAVVGMSPAVVTETVWALACGKNPVIPDRVVVLTTSSGRQKIRELLFDGGSGAGCGWVSLKSALAREGVEVGDRLKFGDTGDSIRIFTSADGERELTDISSSDDNAAAADFMLRHLREFTSNPATTVIASIAGGRKTMSALMISCMSLLGREQDRVCHVLVNPPFDTALNPPFLFPSKGIKHIDREGKKHSSGSAVIELAYVPYVRMLGWYQEKFRRVPPSYSALVASVQRQVPRVHPQLTLDMKTGRVFVDEAIVDLAPTEFMVLCERCAGNTDITSIGGKLKHYKSVSSGVLCDFYEKFKESTRFNHDDVLREDVIHCDSAVRRKLKATALAPFVDELIPKRGRAMKYPVGKIRIKGELPFAVL